MTTLTQIFPVYDSMEERLMVMRKKVEETVSKISNKRNHAAALKNAGLWREMEGVNIKLREPRWIIK